MAPTAPLTNRALNRATLARQGLVSSLHHSSAGDAVRAIGSLQAQHPRWPPIALAARAADPRGANLSEALDRRDVVRSSLMRITIHVVHRDDLGAMFAVVQPLRLNQWKLIMKADPVDSPLGRRMTAAHAVAIDALREEPRTSLALDQLMSETIGPDATAVTRPGWRDPDQRVGVRAAWRHLAAHVPLVHVPHYEERYGRSRYALAADWLGVESQPMDPDQARAHVARRYLAAFGPASVDDLAAYVGRGKGGIGPWRRAVAALSDELVELRADDGRTLVDLADAPRPGEELAVPPRLLARWDSLLLSHETKRRDRIIGDAHRATVYTRNGDVLPTILLDGFVAGTWDLETAEDRVTIRLRPFSSQPGAVVDALLAEADRVASLLSPAEHRLELAVG